LLEGDPPTFQQATRHWLYIDNPNIDPETHLRFASAIHQSASDIEAQIHGEPIRNLDSEDGSLAAVLFVRGAFPTRIINGYDPDGRRNLLYPPNAGDMTTPFSQTGIRPPPREEDLRRARQCLLLGETLLHDAPAVPRFTWEGEYHLCEYPENAGQTGRERLEKRDFELACYTLASNTRALNSVYQSLRIQAGNMAEKGLMAEKIVAQITALNERVLKRETVGYYRPLDLANLNFKRASEFLQEGAKSLRIEIAPDVSVPWAVLDKETGLWHCGRPGPECGGYVLGRDQPAVDGECPNCHFPYK
jgi:hypothetical protein